MSRRRAPADDGATADLFSAPAPVAPGAALPANALCEPLAAQAARLTGRWGDIVRGFLQSAPGQALQEAIEARRAAGRVIYPAAVFRALELTPLDAVRVLILGQDPYHGPGQAQGLAFSVPAGGPLPPSLRNIYKELKRDLGAAPGGGDLSAWARQGVLLLNTTLTVEDGQPASHAALGWGELSDALICAAAADPRPKAFLLWGAHAQRKQALIDAAGAGRPPVHLVLQANHPSPLSATRGPQPFIGCGHFGQVLRFGREQGWAIDWA